jgi:hypothetical protein
MKAQAQLRLDLDHASSGLEGQPGEAVGSLGIRSADASDDDAPVEDRPPRRHQPPERLQHSQGALFTEAPGLEVAREEGAEDRVQAPVVVDAGDDRVDPGELQRFAQDRRGPDRDVGQDVRHLP